MVEKLWPRYDKDKSGLLEKQEAMLFFKNIFSGTPASQYDSYFTMMDVDGNGTINKNELIMFLRENCN